MWNDPEFASKVEWDAYAWFGFAISAAQMLEKQLLAIAVALASTEKTTASSESTDFGLYDSLGRLTLGNLLARVRGYEELPDDLVMALKIAVDTRNDLAHRFFWGCEPPQDSEFPLVAAQRELLAAASLFSNLSDRLLLASESLIRRLRLERSRVEQQAAEALGQPL
jgi:hypothetical protein